MDLALNNLQRLICHKTKQTKPNLDLFFFEQNHMTSSRLIIFVHICTGIINSKQCLLKTIILSNSLHLGIGIAETFCYGKVRTRNKVGFNVSRTYLL